MPRSAELSRRVLPASGVSALAGTSAAIAAGGWVFLSGYLAALGGALTPAAAVDPDRRFLEDALEKQSRVILQQAAAALAAAGSRLDRDIVRIWQWIRADYPSDADYVVLAWPGFTRGDGYVRAARELISDPVRASTAIGVRQLRVPEALIQIDLIAAGPGSGTGKQPVEGLSAEPTSYVPAVRWGDWVFLSGSGATDFKGDWFSNVHMDEPSMVAPEARVNPYIWLGSEIEAQTDYTLHRLQAVAERAGSSLDRCVKAEVTLCHPSDYLGFERVWRRWFPHDPPARQLLTGTRLVLKGLRVEIALTLLAGASALRRETVEVPGAALPPWHAPHAVRAGDLVFISGQLAVDENGAVLKAPGRSGEGPQALSASEQADYLLDRIASICAAAGGSLGDLCRVQSAHCDLATLPQLMDAWTRRFGADPPTLTPIGVGGPDPLLAPGAHMQLDGIAYIPG